MKKLIRARGLIATFLALTMMLQPNLALALDGGTGGSIKDKIDRSTYVDGREAPYKSGEVFIKLNGKVNATGLLKKFGLRERQRHPQLGYILASTSRNTDIPKLVEKLQKEQTVQYAQPNYIYQLFNAPNDPQFYRQWAMKKVNAEQGWATIKPKNNVIVAVLDTGVDVNHPDLKGRLVPGINTVNPLKSARDNLGHGTHVAGIVGATTNNATGIAGLAPAKIMPVKVFDEAGGNDLSISEGLIWAVNHGAKVINMSFGSFDNSQVLNEAIKYAYQKGVILVAAAGNWASQDISSPAALDQVISVSATNKNDKLAAFSSYGPQIDISAPGEDIYSTVWDPYKGSTYTQMSGTSMAAPMVAGLAALLLEKNPKLTNEQVRQIIEASAVDLGDRGWDPQFGHGRIDVNKALRFSLSQIDDKNGTLTKATKLSGGVAVKGKIDYVSDEDWYKIYVPLKNSLQVEVLPAGKVSPGMEIYSPEGELISAANTGEEALDDAFPKAPTPNKVLKVAEVVYGLVTNLEEGNYYIKVYGNHFRWSEEEYTLKAQTLEDSVIVKDSFEPNNNNNEAKASSVGTALKGAILSSGDEDWFKVRLSPGAYLLQASAVGGLNLAIDLESEANFKESDSTGGYSSDYFAQTVDMSGQGEAEKGVIVIPEKGEGNYYIRVYDVGGAAANENYTLQISGFDINRDRYEDNDTVDRAKAIPLEQEITANFHQAEDTDWFELDIDKAGILSVRVTEPQGKMAYDLYLYSETEDEPIGRGNELSGLDLAGSSLLPKGQQVFDFKVAPGKYRIEMSSYGIITSGDYKLNTQLKTFNFIDREPNDLPSGAQVLLPGVITQGTLYPSDDVDFYVLDIDQSQPYLVYITPPAGLDTAAMVLQEQFEPQTKDSNDDAKTKEKPIGDKPTEPRLSQLVEINSGGKGQVDTGVFVPAKPGRYYIAVAAMEGKSPSPYSIVAKPFRSQGDGWEDNNSMLKAKAFDIGTMVRPTFMGTEDVDWFKVYIPGKGQTTITLNVPNDIDGVLEVYTSGGKLLYKVDQSMVGVEEVLTFPVAAAGIYYMKTYDYLGNSSVHNYALTNKFAPLPVTPAPKGKK